MSQLALSQVLGRFPDKKSEQNVEVARVEGGAAGCC